MSEADAAVIRINRTRRVIHRQPGEVSGRDSRLGHVLYAFIDESERDSTHYFLGAIVVTEPQAEAIRSGLDAIVAKHAVTVPGLAAVELHGSTMMRAASAPWRGVPLRMRFRIYEEALWVIIASGARVYIEGVNVPKQLARGYRAPIPARELAFSHLLERVNECCSPDERTVKVVADEHHTAEVSRSNFDSYQVAGTYGYRSSLLPNIEPTIDFIPSDSDRALQAADLVTYLYNRVVTVDERDVRADTEKRRLWAIIEPATRRPRGRARTWP